MQSSYGNHLKLTVFGASHAPEIGMTLEHIPADLPVDFCKLQAFLDRRAPGRSPLSTSRRESDIPHFRSGISGDHTNGQTIEAILVNENANRSDYDALRQIPRPGHADFTAWMKYGPDFDMSGGGPFSGRMTAPLCIAGGLCKQWLEVMGIQIGAHISLIGGFGDENFDEISPQLSQLQPDFPVLNRSRGLQMQEAIAEAKAHGDSLGGIVECAVTGLPIGIGGPLFDGLEGKLSHILYAIPAVKGVDFGYTSIAIDGKGSFCNDEFVIRDGQVVTRTNRCGGILGGLTNGMPLIFNVYFKPTPSIAKPQKSVNLKTMEEVTIAVKGRHDPCIVPRAVPVVEAAAAIAIYDLILGGL